MANGVRVWIGGMFLLFLAGCVTHQASHEPGLPTRGALFEYAAFAEQATGIAISGEGRIFVNFPRWDRDPTFSVAELMPDGSLQPFPDPVWNHWRKDGLLNAGTHFVCVQSVFVDQDDFLWVLDPASPAFAGVVPGGAKLVKIDLDDDRVVQVIPFPPEVATRESYLNDVRIDPEGRFAYISDSGSGAIVVVDLTSGTAFRRLANDSSTKAEPGYVPEIGGKELRDRSGRVPAIHADGIALDMAGEFLYYHALTGSSLYRIRTGYLRDRSVPEETLALRVEKVADTGAVDGMLADVDDSLYLTALEENAVMRRRPDGTTSTIVRDDRIRWPDSMSISPDNFLYFTASQIDLSPRFNDGVDRRTPPYRLFKVWLEPL